MTKAEFKAKATKKNVFTVIGTIAAVAVLYFGYEYVMYVKTDNAQIGGHFVMLAPKVGGYVTAVNIEEGQRVKKGEVLFEIDARDYENRVKEVSGDLSSTEALRKDSERSFGRIRELYSKGVVARQQFDTANAAFLENKAKWEAAEAKLSQAKLNLENTKVVAPSDGYIAKKSVEVGQLANVGQPVVGFVDATDRWVTANFKETDVSSIRPGAKVHISVDAIKGSSYEGKVETISSATGATFTLLPPDNATGNFTKVVQRVPVRIRFENLKPEDAEKLRVGLSADVKVSVH